MEQGIKRQGFTLIELLVVLVIISIATTIVMLSFSYSSETYQAEQLAKRLRWVLQDLQNQALAEARPYSFIIDQGQVKLQRLNTVDEQWQVFAAPRELSSKNLILKPANTIINADGTLSNFSIIISNKQGRPLYQVRSTDDAIIATKVDE